MFPKASTSVELISDALLFLTMVQNYDTQIVNTGIDKRSSMLRSRPRKHSSAASRALHRKRSTDKTEMSQNVPSEGANASEEQADASSKAVNKTSAHPPSLDAEVDELASTMSALRFVPPSVRFGRGGRRGGLSRS